MQKSLKLSIWAEKWQNYLCMAFYESSIMMILLGYLTVSLTSGSSIAVKNAGLQLFGFKLSGFQPVFDGPIHKSVINSSNREVLIKGSFTYIKFLIYINPIGPSSTIRKIHLEVNDIAHSITSRWESIRSHASLLSERLNIFSLKIPTLNIIVTPGYLSTEVIILKRPIKTSAFLATASSF